LSNKIKITCTIIALNEADRISKTLASVSTIADEILLIDSGSEDETCKIANEYGCVVLSNKWQGYGPQKRFAEDHASHDWILNLDADEVLTEELILDILEWKQSKKPLYSGYRFKQMTVYPHCDKPRPFADYHHYVRLYDRRQMRFHESLVHDTVDTKGLDVGLFKGECWHWSWRSLQHLKNKLDGYTTLQATEIRKPTWKLLLRLPIEYPVLLFRYVFLKRHITGGFYGLAAAHTLARGRAARIRKILAFQSSK